MSIFAAIGLLFVGFIVGFLIAAGFGSSKIQDINEHYQELILDYEVRLQQAYGGDAVKKEPEKTADGKGNVVDLGGHIKAKAGVFHKPKSEDLKQ